MNKYKTFTELTDSGPYVTKLILTLPDRVAADAASPAGFSVFVQRRSRQTGEIIHTARANFSPEALKDAADGLSQGWRQVTSVYPCDANGLKMDISHHLALEMSYGPLEPLSLYSAPQNAFQNDFVDLYIRVTQIAPIPGAPSCVGLVFDLCDGDIRPAIAGWQFSDEVSESRPLRYGWFAPQGGSGKRPLLVWLHGAGGGGEDPRYPMQGNRVTAFSSKEGQKKLGDSWIFVPQCPTMWMDDGKGTPLMLNNDSMYIETVKQSVDSFIADHVSEIDTSRVYVAGASNGGYMTLMQTMTYPDFYAAAVPVCAAILSEQLINEQIAALAVTPTWIVHAKNDFVVPQEKTVDPLYQKLNVLGAEVHFTILEKIYDETGLFKNANGTPYEYIPHFAWVPVYNDRYNTDYNGMPVVVDGRAVTRLEWLGMQCRSEKH